MKRLSEYASMAEEALRGLDIQSLRPESLYAPVVYAMEAGGKRIRPALTLMAADAVCGDCQRALGAAMGLEYFHNFTLLHDDVMDKSDMRRNRETVAKKYGFSAAILSGDAMLGIAEKLMLGGGNGCTELSADITLKVMRVFNRMSMEVYEGQALDMEFEQRDDVAAEEYIEMIRLKTGALLGACAEIGAIIGGADEKTASELREYGENLGIAFQIEDDWLDTFGDSATFGKPIGGDINQGKKTFLLVSGLSANGEEAKALRMAMTLPAGDVRVKTVTRIYEKMHLDDICRKEAARYSAAAMRHAKASGLPEESLEAFKSLIDKLTGRRK